MQLLGASIPRSGHHYLVRMLRSTLGSRLYYCEKYTAVDCCNAIPCTKASGHDLVFLKSHDFDNELDPARTDVRYLVQYRNAVEAIVSDRELYVVQNAPAVTENEGQYAYWLGERAHYFIRFARKWLRHPRDHHFLLDYDDLLREPAERLRALLKFCGVAFDDNALRHAVQEQSLLRDQVVANSNVMVTTAFSTRRIEDSRFYEPTLLGSFEAVLAESAPELVTHRRFPKSRVDDSIVGLVALCRSLEGQLSAAERIPEIKRRLVSFDGHRYAHAAAARALRAGGDLNGAAEALARAIAMGITDTSTLVEAVNVHRAQGKLDRAIVYARRLIEDSPRSGSHRLFLANLLIETGRTDEAIAHAVDALALGITQPHLLAACSNILKIARDTGYRIDIGVTPPTTAPPHATDRDAPDAPKNDASDRP
ncbi:MAG: tetratricopeptide repeat protein [Alphaproteobacteria bacterium]